MRKYTVMLTQQTAPKPKKRKTEQPEEVGDDEDVEAEAEDEVEGKELEDDAEDAAGDDDEDADEDVSLFPHPMSTSKCTMLTYILHQAEDTAKSGGPAAAAKAAKEKDVPKEADLEEVDDAE